VFKNMPPNPKQATTVLSQDPELLGDFILESREHLGVIEAQLLTLEQSPGNLEAVNAIFRGFHTIKGLAGFLDMGAIQEVAHEVETVLDLARTSKLAVTSAVVDVVLESADYLKQQVGQVEAALGGRPANDPVDNGPLVGRIRTLMAAQPDESPFEESNPEPARIPAAAEGDSVARAQAVKVDTAKLDYLVDMVGEMVIAQSLVRHHPDLDNLKDSRLVKNLSQLSRVTSEVQKTAMAMRMVPIGQLFHRMARLVRDLSHKFAKQVELVTEGEETELDRNIVEALADPLMHMVRNAIDHGIEAPAEREAAGKAPAARVGLRAFHQAGHVVIEIADDGRGIDREKVRNKALEKGLIDATRHLSDAEVFELILEPGFSTANEVTDVSGRGVGMDVVRKHIQKLKGRIEIQSAPGVGTTFLLKVPLTLAIIEGLVVTLGQARYIIPLANVKEMLRPTAQMLSTVQGRGEMALIRGRLLPVVRLGRRFGIAESNSELTSSLLVIVEGEGESFCLAVDAFAGKQEVVIKSLGESFKNVSGIAGGAILGDGRVALIVDVEGVFHKRANGRTG
jgi:two-component system chemotaxis sensor kinase CheA